MLFFMVFCTVFILTVKDGMSAIRFRYYFSPYCDEINAMFSDEKTYNFYAKMDREYLPKAQTTGIY
jgi:hypothetical protein